MEEVVLVLDVVVVVGPEVVLLVEVELWPEWIITVWLLEVVVVVGPLVTVVGPEVTTPGVPGTTMVEV